MPSAPSDQSHLMGVYSRANLAFERGEGAWLISTGGERYLDAVAGIAVNALGHANPVLVAALKAQADKLWHVSNIFKIPEQEALADRLTSATFADVVFFTNSGTEAVECALKTARKYVAAKGQPERIDIIGVAIPRTPATQAGPEIGTAAILAVAKTARLAYSPPPRTRSSAG